MINGRYIIESGASGSDNMATDEALVSSALSGLSGPTLRFYEWNPYCISLGFHQPLTDINSEKITSLGYDIVRRPTGGRAVFHAHELTYSLILPLQIHSPMEWYHLIHSGFIEAFSMMGLSTDVSKKSDQFKTVYKEIQSPPCFISSAVSEILVKGKKVVGSAQRVFGEFVLQHGSIPIDQSYLSVSEFMTFTNEKSYLQVRQLLNDKSTYILKHLPTFNREKFYSLAVESISKTTGIRFEKGEIFPEEKEIIYHLQKKYRRVV